MAQIDIKVNSIRSSNSRLKGITSDLSDTQSRISSLRHAIDSQITSRQGIGVNLSSMASSIQEIEKRLNQLHNFVDNSVAQYEQADKQVNSQSQKLTEPPKKSFWESVGDFFGVVGDSIKGFGTGLWDVVVSTVEGIWNIITHPVETFKGLVHVIQHPVETAKGIWDAIKTSWNEDVINGDAESRGNWFGRAFGEIALAVVGTKGVDKAVKLTRGAKTVDEVGGVRIVSGVDDLLTKSTCPPDVLNSYLQKIDRELADEYTNTGVWPEHIQIPKDPSVLKPDGSIKWEEVPKGGYVLDQKGNPIKDVHTPVTGELIDRYGPPNGRYTSPVIDGKPFDYDQRSLPYVEDPTKYHQYKIIGDFNQIETYFNNTSDLALKEKITSMMDAYDLSFDDLKVQKGEIAPGFGSTGGGIQYEMPLSVDILEGLGLVEKLK
nr:TNT domain-containing protein [Fredinandcohnia onubensis]